MKTERDKYIKDLMEKYNIYTIRELHNTITIDEYNKLIALELRVIRGA